MGLQTIEKIKKEAHPKLREELQKIYEEANNKLGKSRLRFSMILRTFKEQDDIYAQGRTKKVRKLQMQRADSLTIITDWLSILLCYWIRTETELMKRQTGIR